MSSTKRDEDQKISNKEARVKIINPYLKKKKKKAQISQTAINSFLFSTKTDTKDHERKEADTHNAKSCLPLANDVQLTDKTASTKTPNSVIPNVNTKPIITLQKQDIGLEISIEQRLPSRNVSFGCAEHLSVTELREFLRYYTNRSVRITGIILHRHLVETDASICLVVGDPLARNQVKRSSLDSSELCTPKGLNRRTTSIDAKTAKKSVSFKNKTALGSAKVSSFGKITTKRTPLYSRGGLGVKRRLVHIPKTPGSCTLLGKNSNKRRSPFSSRIESAINCLVNRDDSILAILNPLQHPEVADCNVGDLIMLIGEIHFMSCNEEPTTAAPFLSHYRSKAEKKEARFLVPRILRNVNGTNVRLQHEAIKRRREHILLVQKSHPIQAGRGPPRLKQAPLAPT